MNLFLAMAVGVLGLANGLLAPIALEEERRPWAFGITTAAVACLVLLFLYHQSMFYLVIPMAIGLGLSFIPAVKAIIADRIR